MEYAIKLNNVSKCYKNQQVLDKVSIHIKKGSIYGLVGANGAGKTTIMKSILALTCIDAGTIEIFGDTIKSYRDVPYYKIGNMIETPSFYPHLTAKENLQVICKGKGLLKENTIDEALKKVGLSSEDKKVFSHYSLGMKQRLGLANAINLNPALLILDEPTNGLDPNGIVEVREILNKLNKEQKTTILISSHILSEIEEISDTIGAIKKGKIVEECPISDIYNRGKKYVVIRAENRTNITVLLERKLGICDYEILPDERVKVFCETERSCEINTMLVNNGVRVHEIACSNSTSKYLEEFYMELMGVHNND